MEWAFLACGTELVTALMSLNDALRDASNRPRREAHVRRASTNDRPPPPSSFGGLGYSYAMTWPWQFYCQGHPFAEPGRGHAAARAKTPPTRPADSFFQGRLLSDTGQQEKRTTGRYRGFAWLHRGAEYPDTGNIPRCGASGDRNVTIAEGAAFRVWPHRVPGSSGPADNPWRASRYPWRQPAASKRA
jgi:hypothetical protein